MWAAKHDSKHTDRDFYQSNLMFYAHSTICSYIMVNFIKEQSCTYLAKFLPLTPTAEFCASPTDKINSATFCILEHGVLHSNQVFSPSTLAYDDLPANYVWLKRYHQFRKYSGDG